MKTALYKTHLGLGAKMVDFAGYQMPVQYSGLMDEHMAVRSSAGLFDVSHMGYAHIRGPGALQLLDRALTRSLHKLQAGQAAYSLFCFENGSCIDDLIVYYHGPQHFSLILNASNKDRDFQELQNLALKLSQEKKLPPLEISPADESVAIFALQGPRSPEILKACGFAPTQWPSAFTHQQIHLDSTPVSIAFTGYTGELGCELMVSNTQATELWNSLLQKGKEFGLQPCGLGARDTLRLEMGYSLYGHELSENINPIEAGLKWAVDFNDAHGNSRPFQGSEALQKALESPARKLICLRNEGRKAPRQGMDVLDANERCVGQVTSGSFSPSLKYVIGMALVDANSTAPYQINIRNERLPFELCKRPFYKKAQSS